MEVGALSQLQTLSYDDLLLMIKLLPNYSENLALLLDIFHSEDDLVKFLDLFAGRSIKFPPRTKLFHTINNIHIYNDYVSKKKTSKTADLDTAHKFNITTQRVKTIYETIEERKKL